MSTPARPFGFTVLAAWIGLSALGTLALYLFAPRPPRFEVAVAGARFVMAASMLLASLAAAALWRAEPWAARAVEGWAVASLAQYAVTATSQNAGPVPAVGLLFVNGGVLVAIVAYVRHRTRSLHAPAPTRRVAAPGTP